jgi:undecaprenyl-diphosphatase
MNRLQQLDLSLCLQINRAGAYPLLTGFFRIISRLGNGVFWYSMMIALPIVYGTPGINTTLHMLTVAAPSLLAYKYLKRSTSRPRPCNVLAHITQHGPTLDQYSFPSGHTLHAVAFTLVACHHFPGFAWVLAPFTLLVAISRPLLGLHYPSDVLAGAVIGAVVALGCQQLPFFFI